MKHFKELAKYFSQKQLSSFFDRWNINHYDKQPLGRWNIDYCSNKINTKVKLANEDNSGPSGQYVIINDK